MTADYHDCFQLSTLVLWTLALLALSSTRFIERFSPYLILAVDLFVLVAVAVVNLLSTAGAIQTLQWEASQYYDDATSGHDGYYIFNPDRDQPGQPRLIKVPPQNATICSSFGGDCAAQETFTSNTHHRAKVEIAGCVLAWIAV